MGYSGLKQHCLNYAMLLNQWTRLYATLLKFMKLKTLIDNASEKCGSDAKLAEVTGMPVQTISNLRHGQRPVSPENAAAFCAVLGLSPEESRQWVALAVVENPKNSSKSDMLKKALFASIAAITLSGVFHPENANATPLTKGLTGSHSVYYVNSQSTPKDGCSAGKTGAKLKQSGPAPISYPC